MKIAVIGPKGFASFRIRGQPLAAVHDWACLDVRKQIKGHYDVIWLVKRNNRNYKHVRSHCDKLVCDPLDFWHWPNRVDPVTCWRTIFDVMPFDAIISTSPACRNAMKEGLAGTGVPVHMLPHQCDHRVKPEWYNPDGPIVYAGIRAYVKAYEVTLTTACEMIGRKYHGVYSEHHGQLGLDGASLVIALRSNRYKRHSQVTRHCMP